MNASYEVINNMVVKKYEDGQVENLCMIKDIDIVINRTRRTLDRMESKLINLIEGNEDSALSLMFHDYVRELNELKKISLM